jgi:type IV secretory pathway VirB10-like protein
METGNLTAARVNGNKFAESSLDHPPQLWAAPSLAPTETLAARDIFFRQDAFGEEYRLQPPGSNRAETETSFGPPRNLIAGIGIVAALAVGALAYFFWAPAGEKTPAQTAELAPIVQPVAPVQAAQAPSMPEQSPTPPNVVAGPDLPSSVTVKADPQVVPAAPTVNAASRRTVPASQNRNIVFLQRPGVHIRSTPSANGKIVGTAPKGKRFQITNREGEWVQVESGPLKGWINSQFLAPNEPRAVRQGVQANF